MAMQQSFNNQSGTMPGLGDNANSATSVGPIGLRSLLPRQTCYQFTPQLRFATDTIGQRQPLQQHSHRPRGSCPVPTPGHPHSGMNNSPTLHSPGMMAPLPTQRAVQPFKFSGQVTSVTDDFSLQRHWNRAVAPSKDGTPQPHGRVLEAEKSLPHGEDLAIEDLCTDQGTHAVELMTPSICHVEKSKKALDSRASSPKLAEAVRPDMPRDMRYVDLLRQASLPIGKKHEAASARGKKSSEPPASTSLASSARIKFSRHVASPALHRSKQRPVSLSDDSANSQRIPAALHFIHSRPQEQKKKPRSTHTPSSRTSSHATNENTVSHATHDAAISISSSSTTLAPTNACSLAKNCPGENPPVTLNTNNSNISNSTAHGTVRQQQFEAPVAVLRGVHQGGAQMNILVPNCGRARITEVEAETRSKNTDSGTLQQHHQRLHQKHQQQPQLGARDVLQCTSMGVAMNKVSGTFGLRAPNDAPVAMTQSPTVVRQQLTPALAQNVQSGVFPLGMYRQSNSSLQCTLAPNSIVRTQSVRSLVRPSPSSTMMRTQSISSIPTQCRPTASAMRANIPTPQQHGRSMSQLQSPLVLGSVVRSMSCHPILLPSPCPTVFQTGQALAPLSEPTVCAAQIGAVPTLGVMGSAGVQTAHNALCAAPQYPFGAEEPPRAAPVPHHSTNPMPVHQTRMATEGASTQMDAFSSQKSGAIKNGGGIDVLSPNYLANDTVAKEDEVRREIRPSSREVAKCVEYERSCGKGDDPWKRVATRRSGGAGGSQTINATKPPPFR
eukprot:GEMP01010894.1.p1 GENE.GEMP01010894.1~~GEMP01010894.1.p1  ORF type:complete len:780 (+),score=167.34 GEMP01010894.1:249-2588(+)